MKFNRLYFLDENRQIAMCSFNVLEKLDEDSQISLLYYFPTANIRAKNIVKWVRRFHAFQSSNKTRLIVCTDVATEARWLRTFGIEAIFANQNMNCSEHDFHIMQQVEDPTYDAVYAAQLKSFKRIELAEKIDRIYVITYKSGTVADLHSAYPTMLHADFNTTFLDHHEVCSIYNRANCGLALSWREGAMWASMEYQLAGLPVVSTPSRGGRMHYYDPETWVIAEPTASGVRSAVDKIVARGLPRTFVRERALEKVNNERRRFHERVLLNANEMGIAGVMDFERVWGQGIAQNSSIIE